MGKNLGTELAAKVAKFVGIAAVVYVAGFGIYAFFMFGANKARFMEYGLSEATAHLLGIVVMLIAIALPLAAATRILFLRGKPIDYVAVLVLPLIVWGTKQIPANFSATTGEALKYCAERPDGEVFCLDHEGVDPKTGQQLIAVTRDSIDIQLRREGGLAPRKITIPFEQIRFFDELDGRPLVWIYSLGDGCFEPFDNRGIHPVRGVRLEPVTPDDIAAMRSCLSNKIAEQQRARELEEEAQAARSRQQALAERQSYQARYSNRPNGNYVYGVAVADDKGSVQSNATRSLAVAMGDRRSLLVLRDVAFADGVFERLYRGDPTEFSNLQLNDVVDKLVLGIWTVEYSANRAVQGATNAQARFAVRVIDASSGVVVASGDYASTVLGYTQQDADEKAINQLMKEVASELSAH